MWINAVKTAFFSCFFFKNVYNYNDISSSTLDVIKKDLDESNILAGITSVKGSGITVTLDDTAAIEEINQLAGYNNPNVYIIPFIVTIEYNKNMYAKWSYNKTLPLPIEFYNDDEKILEYYFF